ncbi:DUF177 domain-containing protein [Aureimonas sp. AU20]|uniref:YceD family protein n=1 Tax=Aureimonas sp. AU20 TaxID=1349819 RepID=UPI00071EB700|nr:DUF177 domain-containing protein [Aureimonas sp. AU20]ALN73598.1 hypothetical protein M673_12795 [Aureimonas sp. AU20]
MNRPDPTIEPAPLKLEVAVTKLPQNGMPVRFEASADERAALADLLGILSVEKLEADLTVRRWKRDGVEVDGRFKAEVTQACVVTTDPVREKMDERVEVIFVPEGSRLSRIAPQDDGELHLDPEGADIPETFTGDRIDLGAYLTEIVGLALDPYPRSEGVEFEEIDTDPEPDGGRVSPFAALSQFKTPK